MTDEISETSWAYWTLGPQGPTDPQGPHGFFSFSWNIAMWYIKCLSLNITIGQVLLDLRNLMVHIFLHSPRGLQGLLLKEIIIGLFWNWYLVFFFQFHKLVKSSSNHHALLLKEIIIWFFWNWDIVLFQFHKLVN